MKGFLSTRYKTGKVEFSNIGVLVDGGGCYREQEGKTMKQVFELFDHKKYKPRFIEVKEDENARKLTNESASEENWWS